MRTLIKVGPEKAKPIHVMAMMLLFDSNNFLSFGETVCCMHLRANLTVMVLKAAA